MSYIEENVNPKKKKVGDCSTRAIVKATGISYPEALQAQCDVAIKTCYGITDSEVVEKVLSTYGFEKILVKVPKGSTRPIVAELAKKTSKKSKYEAIVCRVSNHFVACRDGNYYDIWDCGNKSVYGYYAKLRK